MINLDNLELLGDRVIIQLDELSNEHSRTKGGVEIPLFDNVESDAGRPKAKASNLKHLPKGVILALSNKVKEHFPMLNVGDKVLVSPAAVSQTNHFPIDRTSLVRSFDGIISIHPVLIEAKYV